MPHETRQSAGEQIRAVDSEKRRITVVFSTFDLDSYHTRIDQRGWDYEAFKKNPVIPLAHDDRGYTGSNGLPMAKGLVDTIRTEGQRSLMDLEFPERGVFPLADTVFELARGGFLNAVSVGFEPVEWEDTEEPDERGDVTRVRVYRKQRLLEVSLVTIPSNSNALIQRAAKLNADPDVARRLTEQLEKQIGAAEVIDPTEFRKYKGYFEKKQPANRESTKVLENFYKRVFKEDPPTDEVEAWQRMDDAVKGMGAIAAEPQPVPKTDDPAPVVEIPPEVKTEETPATVAIPVEPEPEPKPEEVTEEIPPPPTPPVEEAPQPERKASVQIPHSVLVDLPGKLAKAYVDAATEALRRGVPLKDVGQIIDGLNQTVGHSFTLIHHGSNP